jgi:hypothetical protein
VTSTRTERSTGRRGAMDVKKVSPKSKVVVLKYFESYAA